MLRTRTAIEDCEIHLRLTKTYGTAIEAYLTQHILVLLCADIQQEIYKMIDERATLVGDEEIRQFVYASCEKILRSINKGDIAAFMELFGAHVKKKFNALLEDRDVTIYNIAVDKRHKVAHKEGAQVSFREVKEATDAAGKILVAVRTALHFGKDGTSA